MGVERDTKTGRLTHVYGDAGNRGGDAGRASGPSDKAVEAAKANVFGSVDDVLAAAHDPALGLDRSVCLRDVVEALRATPELYDPEAHEGYTGEDAAHFIEREFGGGGCETP